MDYLPRQDSQLLAWSANWDTLINASPETYSLTVEQAGTYKGLHDAFAVAYTKTTGPDRGPVATQEKNDAKNALVRGPGGIRELVGIVQKAPTTTDAMRAELNITIADTLPTPVPPPDDPPTLVVEKRYQRTVEISLRDLITGRKTRPEGVSGAALFSWVGDEPPADTKLWNFEGNTGKTTIEVTFPFSVPLSAKVWFKAFWFNPRKQAGPPCNPVSAYLDSGMEAPAEAA